MSHSTAIDFLQLLLQERRKTIHRKSSSTTTTATTSHADIPLSCTARGTVSDGDDNASAEDLRSTRIDETPPTALPLWDLSNEPSDPLLLSEDPSSFNTMCDHPKFLMYHDSYLSQRYVIALENWLHRLSDVPYYEAQPNSSQLYENMGWTTLPHAKRKVAVFTVSPTTVSNGKVDASMQQLEASTPSPSSTLSAHCLDPPLLPFQPVLEAITGLFPINNPPNHILVNYYHDIETIGIMPHSDGPAYYPLTVTISLGAPVIFQFTKRSTTETTTTNSSSTSSPCNPPTSEALPEQLCVRLSGHGSLVAFGKDLYSDYLHSIDPHQQSVLWNSSSNNKTATDTMCRNDIAATDFQTSYPAGVADDSTPVLHHGRRDRISITIRHKYNDASK